MRIKIYNQYNINYILIQVFTTLDPGAESGSGVFHEGPLNGNLISQRRIPLKFFLRFLFHTVAPLIKHKIFPVFQ